MATGLVIHISSGENKHTEVLTDERIRIGNCDDCTLRLRMADLPKGTQRDGLILELARTNGFYRVAGFDDSLELEINGEPVQRDLEIQDGDELRILPSSLALEFFPIRSLPAVVPDTSRETQVAPFIEQAAIESAATARRDDAKVFLREFTRELVREINWRTKLIVLAIIVVLVGGVLYLGYSMIREMRDSRRALAEQNAQLKNTMNEVAKANEALTNLGRSNEEIRNSLSLAVKLRNDYGSGVCLIAGSFYFVEPRTGRPLRQPETQNESEGTVESSGEMQILTPEGTGTVAEYEFVGTGFHVGDGFVVTNRHIAQPWLADDRAQSLSASVGGHPRLKKLNAYFPGQAQPIPLKYKLASPRYDLAVCTLETTETVNDIPILPLEEDENAVEVGKTVVMMGYPNGPDRLLALLDDAEARAIQQRCGSLDCLLGYLGENRRIQPLTTQGNITDLDVRRIAYDARTAEGGSGAPVFGPSGRVIGVNFAIFTENQASNFAVPIQYGIALLERAGRKFPPERDKKEAESSSPPQK